MRLNHMGGELNDEDTNIPSNEWLEEMANRVMNAQIEAFSEGQIGINVDISFDGFNNKTPNFGLFNKNIDANITLIIDGEMYPVLFRYIPNDNKSTMVVTSARPRGKAPSSNMLTGQAPRNSYWIEFRSFPFGNKNPVTVGVLFMDKNTYNSIINYIPNIP